LRANKKPFALKLSPNGFFYGLFQRTTL